VQHVLARRSADFAVVFVLIWIAWTNGSLYLELHGREDGRTRAFVFIQIGILALVAVFAPASVPGATKRRAGVEEGRYSAHATILGDGGSLTIAPSPIGRRAPAAANASSSDLITPWFPWKYL
jgi:hypothetical protein